MLERRGDELQALPGVVGFAIGATPAGATAIHVYVDSEGAAETTGAETRALLAPAPVDAAHRSQGKEARWPSNCGGFHGGSAFCPS